MLPQHLTTNEVKNSSGTEVEFNRAREEGTAVIFQRSGMQPAYPETIKIAHDVKGTGLSRVRRSVTRVDVTSVSEIDAVTPVTESHYLVSVVPEGHRTSTAKTATSLAYLMSLLASKGASTTILYDGTGYGAEAHVNGTL